MAELEHPSTRRLASLLDTELSAPERERMLNHLDACAACSQRLEEIEPALGRFRQCHEWLDRHAPPPPRPWPDIWDAFERADRAPRPAILPPPRHPAKRALWVGALAAGIAAATLILWPMGEGSVVRAETLLRQAAANPTPLAATRRLRVQTPTASFIRTAVLPGTQASATGEAAIRSQFAAAHYDWSDPLNPASYSGWRNRLKQKRDRVDVIRKGDTTASNRYTIVTDTDADPLAEATLTLEATNLTPIGGKFVFANRDWVEISVLPDASVPIEAPPIHPAVSLPARASVPQTCGNPADSVPEREFQVRAAIDDLSTQAGVPVQVEVSAAGCIVVTPYGLDAGQDRTLRTRLASQPGVQVEPNQALAGPPPDAAVSGSRSGPAIDLGDSIAASAHLLNQLADRFPPQVEAKLNPVDRAALLQMRRKHAAQMNAAIESLSHELARADGLAVDSDAIDQAPAYSVAALVRAATSVNRLVTAYCTRPDPASIQPALSAEFARLRHLASLCDQTLQQPMEAQR
jgi:hypothetical protein